MRHFPLQLLSYFLLIIALACSASTSIYGIGQSLSSMPSIFAAAALDDKRLARYAMVSIAPSKPEGAPPVTPPEHQPKQVHAAEPLLAAHFPASEQSEVPATYLAAVPRTAAFRAALETAAIRELDSKKAGPRRAKLRSIALSSRMRRAPKRGVPGTLGDAGEFEVLTVASGRSVGEIIHRKVAGY